MEATPIQECSHEQSSLHNSQSRRFLVESSPLEFQDGANRHQDGNCGHFSIRGYVSEIRKRNWKNNWPFFLPEETNKLEQCKNLLPPLFVIDSRWWRCANCLHKIKTSETEVVPVGCLVETAMPNDCFPKGTSLLPYYHDQPAQSIPQCIKASVEHNSNGLQISQNMSTEDTEMGETVLHLSGRDASNDAVQTCTTSPDYLIQEEIVGKISFELVHEVAEAEACKKGVSKETSEGAISLDLNKPACESSSDEMESGVSPVDLEREASKVWWRPITHESNDVGCLNLNRDIVVASREDSSQCHENSGKLSMMEIPLSMNNGMLELVQKDRFYEKPHEIDFGIKEVDSPLACLNPVNMHTSRELDQQRDNYLVLDDVVENESPSGTSNGSLKRKRAQKMRLLTDILKTKDLAVSEEYVASVKVKNKKRVRETDVENAKHFQTVCTRVLPWAIHNHEGNEETERAGTLASNDEQEPTGKNTLGRKKYKAAPYIDGQALILHRQVISGAPKSSNGIAETRHLTTGRHHKKSKERKQQTSTQETEDIHPWQKNDTSNYGTLLYSQEHISIPRNDDQDWRNAKIQGEAAVDDIPMEIVELLAKNQFERRLNKFQEENGFGSSKSGSDGKYANRADPLCNNVRGSARTMFFSSHSKVSDNIDCNIHHMENSQGSKGFSPWLHPHENSRGLQDFIHDSGSGGDRRPINCMQFLEECRKNQMASQNLNGQVYHDGRMVAFGSTHYDTNQKRSTDLSIRDNSAVGYVKPNLVPPQVGKGKSVLDTNGELFPSLNCPSSRKGNSCQKVVNPMDLSPNESISALDLLMLMQQGASSSAPSMDRREKICKQPHFSKGRSHKLFELEAGASNCNGFPAYSQSFQRISQNQQMRSPFELFPPLGRSGTYSSALIGEHGSSNLLQPSEFRSRFETDMQNFPSKTQRLATTNQSSSAAKVLSPRPNKAGLASSLVEQLSLSHTKKILPTNKSKSHNKIVADLPMRKSSDTEICTLNRNPAEFSLPEDGNIYMIKGECLKRAKASPSMDKTDGRKRQRKAKLTSIREH